MKKILALLMFISLGLANNIKQSVFIGGDYGTIKTNNNQSSDNYARGKIGFYFYDENQYLISNRLYLSGAKVFKYNVDFIITKLNLDWIWNQIPFIKPFIGVNGGYIYYSENNNDTSSASIGMKGGLLFYVGDNIELEMGGEVTHPESENKFPKNFKQVYGGLNISF